MRNQGGGGSKDVALENLVVTNGGEPLIEDASLLLSHGRRYGLLGRNGSGKSTLLRQIANRQVAGLGSHTQVLHGASLATLSLSRSSHALEPRSGAGGDW